MSAANTDFVLKVEGISKRFGGLQALQNVDMHVKPGEFHAIIGPNGAGKSTFFNTLSASGGGGNNSVRRNESASVR